MQRNECNSEQSIVRELCQFPRKPPPIHLLSQLEANVNQIDSGAGSGVPPQVVDEVDRLTQEAVHKAPLNVAALTQGRAKWYMSRWRSMLPLIEDYEKKYKTRSDQDLRRQSLSLRYRGEGRREARQYVAAGVCACSRIR